MSDDYLWDKSGEPDSEIEELEQLLGNLRYRRPAGDLPLPQHAPVPQRRTFTPALAAAAAVLFTMIAAGAWFALGVRSQGASVMSAVNERLQRAFDSPNSTGAPVQPVLVKNDGVDKPNRITSVVAVAPPTNTPQRAPGLKRREPSEIRIASLPSRNRREQISDEEGVAAREQLIKALHLASSKLNLVQKKVQDNKSIGPVS